MLVECPSGLSFNARTWKLRDRKTLTDKRILRNNTLLLHMASIVDEGVVDPGPYDFKVGQKVNWHKAVVQDITAALLQIRTATHPELDMTTTCVNPRCESESLDVAVDLHTVETQPMSAAAIEHIRTGKPMEVMIPATYNGHNVNAVLYLRLLRGADLATLATYYKQDPVDGLDASRLLHVSRVMLPDGTDMEGLQQIWSWYNDQNFAFAETLATVINDNSGGVQSEVTVTCEDCGREQQHAIPFGPDFFLPRTRSTSRSTDLI